MEAIRYFLWPAAFLLALTFFDLSETAGNEGMSMTHKEGGTGALPGTPLKVVAPDSVHVASPKGVLKRDASYEINEEL